MARQGVADLAVQVHGGAGYMRECAGRADLPGGAPALCEGASEIQRLIIGGGLIGEA